MSAEYAERRIVPQPEGVKTSLTLVRGAENVNGSIGEVSAVPSSDVLIQAAVMLRKELRDNLRAGNAHGISFADSLTRATQGLTTEQLVASTSPVRAEMPAATVIAIEKRVRAQVPTGRIVHEFSLESRWAEGEFVRKSVPRDPEEVEAEVARTVALRVLETQARSVVPDEFITNTPHHEHMERDFLHDVDGTSR